MVAGELRQVWMVLRMLGRRSLGRTEKPHTPPWQNLESAPPNTVKLCSWPASPFNPSAGYLCTVHRSHTAHLWQP